MKAICTFALVLAVIAVPSAFAQMYDPAYSGPMNMYGQPTFGSLPTNPPPGSQQQQFPGVIPMALDGMYGVGTYLWSYMPAPVRGAGSPYDVKPGQGQVITNFVPGTR